MRHFWATFAVLLSCGLPLTACIMVPEQAHQQTSTTHVYLNDRTAGDTHVEINRSEVILLQPQDGNNYPDMPARPHHSNCQIHSNGLSMGPLPVICY